MIRQPDCPVDFDEPSRRAHDALNASGVQIDPNDIVQFWDDTDTVELDGMFTLPQLEAIVAAMKAARP